jgi:hypothetical protein
MTFRKAIMAAPGPVRYHSRGEWLDAHAEAFLAEMSAVMPLGYRVEIDGEMLWLTTPGGGRAGSSAYWLVEDVLSEEDALAGAVQSLYQSSRSLRRRRRSRGQPSACYCCCAVALSD